MATRKLTLELDVKDEQAKRKVQGLADGIVGGGVGGGGDRGESTKAAKNIRELGDASKQSAVNMQAATRVFAGMAVGMATSYASKHLEKGSVAEEAINYGGSAISGATMGSIAGPIGMLAGAAMGLAKAFIDEKEAEEARLKAISDTAKANREQLQTMLEAEKRTEAFKAVLDALGDTTKSATDRQAALKEEIAKREAEDARLKMGLENNSRVENTDQETNELFASQMKDYENNRRELERLRSLKIEEDKKEDKMSSFRGDMTGTDSLARLGASFGGGEAYRSIAENTERTVDLLKSIDSKTKPNVGGSWQ